VNIKLPAGVISLGHDTNLFRVKPELITFAEGGETFDPSSKKLKFRNPRRTIIDGKVSAIGFDKNSMDELRESIRGEGLQNPILLRASADFKIIVVLAGERRKRCIDKLISDDAECFDVVHSRKKKAKEVFEYIECRIYSDIDEVEAFRHSFSENDRAIGIGDAANVELIKQWRACGWTDETIMSVTCKSITWVRETEKMAELDNETYAAFAQGKINRTLAIALSRVESEVERNAYLSALVDMSEQRFNKKHQEVLKELEDAEEKLEIAEADVAITKMDGDTKKLEYANDKAKKAKQKVAKKINIVEEIEKEKAQATAKDLKDVQEKLETSSDEMESVKQLTPVKLKKYWSEACREFIDNGTDEDGNDIENVSKDDAKLVVSLCEAFEKGERDIFKLLKRHMRLKKEDF